MLKDPAIKIVEAYDGEAALILLDEMISSLDLPDLIIVDINMPVMDGRQFLSILKSKPETKDIRTIMYTSSSNLFDKMHLHHSEDYWRRLTSQTILFQPLNVWSWHRRLWHYKYLR